MYDVIFLGGGPGGYVGAIHAAQKGLSVALIEGDRIGGTCVNKGCIPTQSLVAGIHLLRRSRKAVDLGVEISGKCNASWPKMMRRKDLIVSHIRSGIEALLNANKVTLARGWGNLKSPGRIEVHGADGDLQFIEGRHTIIATGAHAVLPSIPGIEGPRVITSDEILSLHTMPSSIAVIGGGAIGIEFASILSALGARVTVIEALPSIIPQADEEISRRLATHLRRDGVTIRAGSRVRAIQSSTRGVKVVATACSQDTEIDAECALVSTGRIPNLQGIDPTHLELASDGKGIKVDPYQRTSLPGVYAVGDVTGGQQIAHVASAQAILAVDTITGNPKGPFDPMLVPICVFSDPEVAWIGLTEAAARSLGHRVRTGKFPFSASGRALVMGEAEGFVKIVADEMTREILGAHIVGPHASDLIHEIAVLMALKATAQDVEHLIHAHPTLAEGVSEAFRAVFGRPIHALRLP